MFDSTNYYSIFVIAFMLNVFRLMFFIQTPRSNITFFHEVLYLCFNCDHNDLIIGSYERPMVKQIPQTVRIIEWYEVATIFTDMTDFDNEHKSRFAS